MGFRGALLCRFWKHFENFQVSYESGQNGPKSQREKKKRKEKVRVRGNCLVDECND